jgi:hypothetical protein
MTVPSGELTSGAAFFKNKTVSLYYKIKTNNNMENIKNKIVAAVLGCGYGDLNFLENTCRRFKVSDESELIDEPVERWIANYENGSKDTYDNNLFHKILYGIYETATEDVMDELGLSETEKETVWDESKICYNSIASSYRIGDTYIYSIDGLKEVIKKYKK